MRISPYYASLINASDSENDPIFKQCVPDEEELVDHFGFQDDGLDEDHDSPVPRLIHKYPDRALLLTTRRCSTNCRFCFRKRHWRNDAMRDDLSDEELRPVAAYLRDHPEIREVIVSGGDPLMLSDERLRIILDAMAAIPSIDVIRVGTRIPVTQPNRVNEELADMFAEYDALWVLAHFNHPNELTEEAKRACALFIDRGVPMLNQNVLLKGVNDDAKTLIELYRGLIKWRIKPLYLFHADPVRGTTHFATGAEKGLAIVSEFRGRLSSIATPFFVVDLPEGGGKAPLLPQYRKDGRYQTMQGGWVKHPGAG